jgi:glycosyltransferase involved in cell wall biosynthesis
MMPGGRRSSNPARLETMLENQDIVYISNDWARENKTSAHHIAEVLASRNRVLYVEAAGMRSPRRSHRDFRKIAAKLRKFFDKPVREKDGLYLYSPITIPFHKYRAVRFANRLLLRVLLSRACREVGIEKPLLWIFMPHYSCALDSIDKKGVVYYCVDEYSSQPKVDPETIRLMEREILAKADVVFAVSNALVESKSPHNPNTHLSRHGVDVETFRRAASPDQEVPADISSVPRPIAGFFGLLEEWTDVALIDHLAAALPDVSFVFVGRIACDVEPLRQRANVHFLGQRPYESLPGYLKAFDVCMLLYKQGEFSRNANPKKLREYLAAGKPVVSVRIREVEHLGDLVYIADSCAQYADLLRRAIAEDSPDLRRKRMSAMENESWEAKVERLSAIISERIPGLHNAPPGKR